MTTTCAIIAGSGSFPLQVAREAKRAGCRVVAVGLHGWADPSLEAQVDAYASIPVGELGRLIAWVAGQGASTAIMAGKVTKQVLLDSRASFDAAAQRVLAGANEFSVPQLLGAVAAQLGERGIALVDSSTFLRESLCPAGTLTRRQPTPEEQADIRLGTDIARQLARWDVGQTVVVKRTVVVAVEALEGTDAAIQRAGALAGPGCVVVKMAAPNQDMRFDVPVLGINTVAAARAAGVTCLAVHAGKTLLLDRDACVSQADAAGIALVGVEPAA
ncbi:MAG: UDP-2,3-diacylglucosamine diphosphatase LpxI [Candidatus Omnitrophica bacterium]|nr:UDP-2,3-diacylglucosamine diphosphatase LpxI [Candidatus Omnitrophota bacterium]